MGIGKTTLVFTLPGGTHATPGMWFEYIGTDPDLVQLTQLSEDIAVAFAASSYQNDLDADTILTQVESQLFEVVTVPVSQTYPYGRRNSPTSLAGLAVSVPVPGGNATTTQGVPPQICMGVSLQSARAGKSYRGRVYMPPLLESSIGEDGSWSSGAVTECRDFVSDWFDAIGASGPVALTPVVHGLAVPSDEPIVSIVGRTKARTQRRRIKLTS